MLAVPAGAAGGDAAGGDTAGGAIAFSSARGGRASIWVVDSGGALAQRLTSPAAPARPCRCRSGDFDAHPAWSADGRRLAFTRGARIVVTDAAGHGALTVPAPPGAEDAEPVWSSRGRLAFVRERAGSPSAYRVVTANARGGDQRVLAETRFLPRSLAWSPDGRRLAYVVAYRDPAVPYVVGLFHVAAAGGRPRFVLRAVGFGELAWSPDGRSIAFASSVPDAEPFDPFRLFTIRLADHRIRQLTRPAGTRTGDAAPRWSPDGRTIVFVRTDPRRSRILSIRPDGRGVRVLSNDATAPVWSPDGSRLAFVDGLSGRGGRPLTVSLMRRDGSERRVLAALRRPADGGVNLGAQSWRPLRSAGALRSSP